MTEAQVSGYLTWAFSEPPAGFEPIRNLSLRWPRDLVPVMSLLSCSAGSAG